MKVLMLSTDSNILDPSSDAYGRMLEYAKLFAELHVVVYTCRQVKGERLKVKGLGNLFIYPTNTVLKPLYFWQAYRIAVKILQYSDIQKDKWVITTQDPFETGLVGVWLKNKFKIPLQAQCHVDFLNIYFWKESLKNKFRTLLAKFVLRRADGIRVVSERISKSVISYCLLPKSCITVLPIFVDTKKIIDEPIKIDLHKKYSNYDFIILMASRLSREKNIELAIASMKEVVLKYPRALLLIVGEGRERYGLEKNIILESWNDDLISYYKTADLFLLTSNYEGYGRTMVEAITAGLPVVATDVGVAPQIVVNSGGLVVPVGDKDAISEAILEMLKRKEQGNLKAKKDVIKDMPSRDEYLRSYKESLSKLISE